MLHNKEAMKYYIAKNYNIFKDTIIVNDILIEDDIITFTYIVLCGEKGYIQKEQITYEEYNYFLLKEREEKIKKGIIRVSELDPYGEENWNN